MPTQYPGDPTAAASPSLSPRPEVVPIANIPIAGELRTVSSISQFVRAAFNELAWFKKPRARSLVWEEWVLPYLSPAGHRRFSVDHFGFPSGRINSIREDFAAVRGVTFSPADMASPKVVGQITVSGAEVLAPQCLPGWKYKVRNQGSDGTGALNFDTYSGINAVSARLRPATANGDFTVVQREYTAVFGPDVCFSAEFDFQLTGTGSASNHVHLYLGNRIAGGYPFDTLDGIELVKNASSANFQYQVGNGTGAPTAGVTSVAADTAWHRLKITWLGANVSPSGTARAVLLLDGGQIADLTGNLPQATTVCAPGILNYRTNSGSVTDVRATVPIISSNTWVDGK